MNINYLDFFEIGNCMSEATIYNRVKNDMYGFYLEDSKSNFEKLKVPANINKLYYSSIKNIDLDNLLSIYNIITIDYLKIDMDNNNYSLMDKFLNSQRPLLIDKIELKNDSNEIHFKEIIKKLIDSNYSLIYTQNKHFFLANSSISRLIIKPNNLDLIFIENIKRLENIQ